jgi:hypothetical protein
LNVRKCNRINQIANDKSAPGTLTTTSHVSEKRNGAFTTNHDARLGINLIPTKLIGINFSISFETA